MANQPLRPSCPPSSLLPWSDPSDPSFLRITSYIRLQIHDQGAGGNCNVVKEIIYPLGAKIDIRAVKLGDETMSVMEIWGAEYQENDCLLIK
jgi:phosphoribosylformylglycinamidine (FGAM) synthase-like enzyme